MYSSADQAVRPRIVDWLEALQPIGAPSWTHALSSSPPRTARDGDLDQPRSATQRDRLLADLTGPAADRRDAAATALRDWPEPEIRRAVLHAFLQGRADLKVTAELARAGFASVLQDESVLQDADPARLLQVVAGLAHPDLIRLVPLMSDRLVPLMLEWWESEDPRARATATQVLHRVPADALAERLHSRLDSGSWGFLDLLAGQTLLRTPFLDKTRRRLQTEGRPDLADRLVLTDGPFRTRTITGEGEGTTFNGDTTVTADTTDTADLAGTAVLATLRERPEPTADTAGQSRAELFAEVRTGPVAPARRALTRLAEAYEDSRPADGKPDPELVQLLNDLMQHSESRLRAHAHRLGRRLLDHPTYLRQTTILLEDPEPDLIRSAIKTLSHANHKPAIPALITLLTHSHPIVRRAATEGLTRFGPAATPALRYAADHARPDKRHLYEALLT
ncbi:HEAT repeat domain-containing protein [Actinoplanes couchii]|uniref:PBS lyase HEAT domain protein repeat-containing protein n=1 Tax=Actinoplanes couchii TaxID=403638 RepID=A0ABQ3XH15_9ACTN|nr:HEAT repeat domain-containing protein [Actinoplanes couchii]MDR6320748.1 hypothetical protein [Actinoplanes couchii]GID57766.1 hypothetical protein Aco03nite_061700 [Actinoplanes couchii]